MLALPAPVANVRVEVIKKLIHTKTYGVLI